MITTEQKIKRNLKIANWLVTTTIAIAVFLCMWVVYDRGLERGENRIVSKLTYEYYKPDTTGLKVVVLSADPYDIEVTVVIGRDTAKAVRLIRYYLLNGGIRSADLNARGVTFWPDSSGIGIPVVWLPEVPTTPDEQGVLAHELTHVSHMIMMYCGTDLTEESLEAYAYLHGFLTRQFYEQCLELK